MSRRWHIDECDAHWVSGWIDDDGPVDAITIAVDGCEVARLAPTAYRQDLEVAGIGDGRRSFRFAISQHLTGAENTITIRHRDVVLHSGTLRAVGTASAAERDREPDRRRPAGVPLLEGVARQLPRDGIRKEACDFYHVVNLPDGTTTAGQWDLRRSADEYLGHIDFAGKSVLEIGPASGFLSFHMERRGGQVAVVEPPMTSFWDMVPQSTINLSAARQAFAAHIERIRNSFWYLHAINGSRVECYEVDAYRIPPQPRPFDIGLLASVLLHVSSPARMLESLASVVADQIVIVERYFPELSGQALCRLVPSEHHQTIDTWWDFSPRFLEQYLGVLGFPRATVTRHRQLFATINQECEMFTIVASR